MTERPPLDPTGAAAPPRRNGELVFAAPWESRLFGLTLALHAAGHLDWEAFRARLIAEIAAWESNHHPDEPWSYYGCWLAALEGLLAETGLCATGVLTARVTALAGRPAGHDHPRKET